VNYEFRVQPLRSSLREHVLAGAVGPVEHVQWTLHTAVWAPGRPYRWTADAALGGGWIRASSSHHIDFLRWTFGEITEASALLRTTVPQRADRDGTLHDVTAEDGFVAALRTDQGVTISIDSTATGAVDRPTHVTVIGRDGVLEVVTDSAHEIGGSVLLHTSEGTTELFKLEPWGDVNAHDDSAMMPWTTRIVDVVRGTPDPVVPDFADGLAAQRVMDLLTRPEVSVSS
jgi:predicted dehydrogenase